MLTDIIMAGLLVTQPSAPAPPASAKTSEAAAPELSELERLKVENYVLRLQAIEAEMTRQRTVIDAAITEAHPGYRWDWQKGVLVAITAEPAAEK